MQAGAVLFFTASVCTASLAKQTESAIWGFRTIFGAFLRKNGLARSKFAFWNVFDGGPTRFFGTLPTRGKIFFTFNLLHFKPSKTVFLNQSRQLGIQKLVLMNATVWWFQPCFVGICALKTNVYASSLSFGINRFWFVSTGRFTCANYPPTQRTML